MTVSINIPDELYNQAQEIAASHHIPVEEIFASAFADQSAVWKRLRDRANRADRQKFLTVLDSVPDVEPEEYDRL